MITISKTIFTSIALMATSTIAMADDTVPPTATTTTTTTTVAPTTTTTVAPTTPTTPAPTPPSDGTNSDGLTTPGATAAPTAPADLPKAESDNDVQPEVAGVGAPDGGIVSQAGVGGVVGYGRAGVLELGGSAGFAFASDYRQMNFSPTIGWFLADNLELSAIVSIANIKTGDQQSTLWSALFEPSYHVPFNRSVFGFLGLGAGAAYVSGLGTGFAVAPRIGANFMVGRSGVLTPSLDYQYTTIKSEMTAPGDVTVVALTSAMRFNVGYTAMW